MNHLCPAWQHEEKEVCQKCLKKEKCNDEKRKENK